MRSILKKYDNQKVIGHSITLITAIIWGTTFISTKVLLKNLEPIEILFYRFLIAYCALLIIYPKFKKIQSLKEELLFLAAGLSSITLGFLFQNIALRFTTATNVGLLMSTAPIFMAIFAHLLTRDEKLNKNLAIGSIIAIFGVAFVILSGNFTLKINPFGDFLAIVTSILCAIYSIILKKLGDSKYNYIYLTRKIFFYGVIATIPFLFIFKFDFEVQKLLSPDILFNILFLGLAASSLCFVMWSAAVNLIGVVKTGNYLYLTPLITMITAAIILHEKITILEILGALLILSGVYISEHSFKEKNEDSMEK